MEIAVSNPYILQFDIYSNTVKDFPVNVDLSWWTLKKVIAAKMIGRK